MHRCSSVLFDYEVESRNWKYFLGGKTRSVVTEFRAPAPRPRRGRGVALGSPTLREELPGSRALAEGGSPCAPRTGSGLAAQVPWGAPGRPLDPQSVQDTVTQPGDWRHFHW